jgi:hypothetical protein
MSKKLKFGLPKGSLQDATIEKMAKAGYNIQVSSRSYVPYVDDEGAGDPPHPRAGNQPLRRARLSGLRHHGL